MKRLSRLETKRSLRGQESTSRRERRMLPRDLERRGLRISYWAGQWGVAQWLEWISANERRNVKTNSKEFCLFVCFLFVAKEEEQRKVPGWVWGGRRGPLGGCGNGPAEGIRGRCWRGNSGRSRSLAAGVRMGGNAQCREPFGSAGSGGSFPHWFRCPGEVTRKVISCVRGRRSTLSVRYDHLKHLRRRRSFTPMKSD